MAEQCLVIGDRDEKDGALARGMGSDVLILPPSNEDRNALYDNMIV